MERRAFGNNALLNVHIAQINAIIKPPQEPPPRLRPRRKMLAAPATPAEEAPAPPPARSPSDELYEKMRAELAQYTRKSSKQTDKAADDGAHHDANPLPTIEEFEKQLEEMKKSSKADSTATPARISTPVEEPSRIHGAEALRAAYEEEEFSTKNLSEEELMALIDGKLRAAGVDVDGINNGLRAIFRDPGTIPEEDLVEQELIRQTKECLAITGLKYKDDGYPRNWVTVSNIAAGAELEDLSWIFRDFYYDEMRFANYRAPVHRTRVAYVDLNRPDDVSMAVGMLMNEHIFGLRVEITRGRVEY